MITLNLKPTHAPVKAYYETLEKFGRAKFDNEGNIRSAFEDLLKKCARQFEWTLVPEYPLTRTGKSPLRVDAGLIDAFNLPRAYWEAKDSKDDLRVEMEKKFALGYPRNNILFQSPSRAILFQNNRIEADADISDPVKLVDVLRPFFEYRQPHQEDWDRAVREFSERIPEIAKGAMKLIADERKTNKAFVERFTAFANLCRESINPTSKTRPSKRCLFSTCLRSASSAASSTTPSSPAATSSLRKSKRRPASLGLGSLKPSRSWRAPRLAVDIWTGPKCKGGQINVSLRAEPPDQ